MTLLVPVLGAAWALFAPPDAIGSIGAIQKSVLLSRPDEAARFSPARLKQSVFDAQRMRTMKRSRAIVSFLDGAQLRVNERTELVLHSSGSMRRIELGQGAIWVKVPKGQPLVIDTPTVTASVRGTEFEITAEGEVRVYEGVVEIRATGAAATAGLAINPFESGSVKGGSPQGPTMLSPAEFPRSYGGPSARWWETLILGRDNQTSSDTPGWQDVQESLLLYAYRNEEKGRPPGSKTETFFRGRFDVETDDHFAPYLLGAVSALTDSRAPAGPVSKGAISPLVGEPSYWLAQLDYQVGFGQTGLTGQVTARGYIRRSDKVELHPTSLLHFERSLGSGVTAFTGRISLHPSPIVLDTLTQGVLFDRFTGGGLRWDSGPWQATGGWVYDSDPWKPGHQSSWFGSLSHHVLGGKVTALGTRRTDGPGSKLGIAAVFPLLPTKLDIYGEWSFENKVREGRSTIGAYFPDLFEQSNIDAFVEYQSRRRVGNSWTLYASYAMSTNWSLLTHLEFAENRHSCGMAFNIRF